MKNLFLIGFISLTAMAIIGCSKGNPKNTDVYGDRNRKLIIGKWRKVADTTIYYVDDKLIRTDKDTSKKVSDVYSTDNIIKEYIDTTLDFTGTYKVTKDSVIIYTPPYNSGGVTISGGATPLYIKALTTTDLVLFYDITAIVTVGTVNQKSRTIETKYYKKQ